MVGKSWWVAQSTLCIKRRPTFCSMIFGGVTYLMPNMSLQPSNKFFVMYSFLDRLMNLALPRTRDFQGVNPYSFDGRGNYTLGLPEQSVFPEIRFENIDKERGMDICIITSAKNDLEGLKLLSLMGMPFREAGGGRTSASAAKKKTRVTFRGKSKRR
jgi:hypothetical protein